MKNHHNMKQWFEQRTLTTFTMTKTYMYGVMLNVCLHVVFIVIYCINDTAMKMLSHLCVSNK